MHHCQATSSEDPGDGHVCLGSTHRETYLKEQLFLHHLFRLADESLLQGVNFLDQLKGTGVTGLSEESDGRWH